MVTSTPQIMGILNITPDSFSDGGLYREREAAVTQAMRLVSEGADILDVGGESTRPGSLPVSVQEELDRVIPVLEGIRARSPIALSVDTTKYEVAKAALAAGASIVNDVSGGADIRVANLVKETGATVVLMHMQGTPANMQQDPVYPLGVVTEVRNFLRARRRAFEEVGVAPDKIWIDPGIGFGKTLDQNLDLLRHLEELVPHQGKLLVGTSRKSFLARVLQNPEASFEDRRAGTTVSNLWSYLRGASVFRVHEVGELRRAFKTWQAILFGTLA